MKGVVLLGNRRCEIRDFPVSEPEHGEVLVRVMATGICGSDLRPYRGGEASDVIRGHEPSGVVERVGAGVVHLKSGDRVSAHHHLGCGACYFCAQGEFVACRSARIVGTSAPGSYAEFLMLPERHCIPLPDSVSYIDGAFIACIGSTAFAALRRLGVEAHRTLAVYGLGPVGLSTVILAKAMGMKVIGVDVIAERVALALECGADDVLDATETDVVERVRAFGATGGAGYIDGVDYVIEASGSAPARRNVVPSLGFRTGGKAALLGVGNDEEVIKASDLITNGVTLIGSVVFPQAWAWDLSRFLSVSGVSFEPSVTHRFALEDAGEALHIADEGSCGKVVLLPHG